MEFSLISSRLWSAPSVGGAMDCLGTAMSENCKHDWHKHKYNFCYKKSQIVEMSFFRDEKMSHVMPTRHPYIWFIYNKPTHRESEFSKFDILNWKKKMNPQLPRWWCRAFAWAPTGFWGGARSGSSVVTGSAKYSYRRPNMSTDASWIFSTDLLVMEPKIALQLTPGSHILPLAPFLCLCQC